MLINKTPHPVTIVNEASEVIRVIAPEGEPIRLTAKIVAAEPIDGVPTSRTEFGEAENLPAPQPGTFFIVSQIVKNACLDRRDLLVPAEVVRDANGVIVGCKSLGR